jgi:hypothetical protein
MRGTGWKLGVAGAACMAVVACSSTTVTDGTLPFTVQEGLLLLLASDPTRGAVGLGSTTGNCPAFQQGADFSQIADSGFLYFLLGQLDGNDNPVPLTAGTYTILDPNNASFNGPGLLANAVTVVTNQFCIPNYGIGTDGTVTVSPFNPPDGGPSSVTFSAVFTDKRISGTYPLATCLIPAGAGLDGGACFGP